MSVPDRKLSAAVLLATLCVVAGGIRPASACSCSDSRNPCERYASTPIVFVGDVLSSEETGSWYHMQVPSSAR